MRERHPLWNALSSASRNRTLVFAVIASSTTLLNTSAKCQFISRIWGGGSLEPSRPIRPRSLFYSTNSSCVLALSAEHWLSIPESEMHLFTQHFCFAWRRQGPLGSDNGDGYLERSPLRWISLEHGGNGVGLLECSLLHLVATANNITFSRPVSVLLCVRLPIDTLEMVSGHGSIAHNFRSLLPSL